ncbi:MAG TPA: efflux RND transporter permease subunit [Haliscomenobacter sp.]|uniref:efflux RND transporter permease subunit n=1 Tax=Haliscomenobacter sp. TaxID=2717303 RepID=UPI002CAB4967|nr:efflux RND transporter permease subunit [Haliscomenobacter sp.]HOY20710.1 efflux RND transporter permease subunit [Haliscomenobacter sp.]
MTLTEIAIKRPSLIIVFFAVMTFLGLVSYSYLSYELIPKFNAPIVLVSTIYPGASPSEVENSLTKPLEDAISGVEKIVSIRSTSFEGLSSVIVEFKDGINTDVALQDVQRKINAVKSTLPEDAKDPALGKFSSDDFPIMSIAVNTNLPQAQQYDLIKQRIKPALSQVDGVGQVNLIGGQEREIKVQINRRKLESQGLSLLNLVMAIQSANLEFPTGKVKSENEQITVRLAGKFLSLEDIKDVTVGVSNSGTLIKVRDVAEVSDDLKEMVDLSRLNSKSAIGITVLKQPDANAVTMSDGIKAKIASLEESFKKENLKFNIANDSTDFTRDAVDAVMHDIGLAIILVALVMLVFLHSLRNSLIVMVAIPASLVSTFIGMYLMGFTLNLMTLLAMSLVIGILVDDSIVVLENIYRHLEMGKNRRQAAADGRNEIGFTALAITLVDVVVFFPITLAGGIVGNIMGQFAWVVVFSTLMSLLVSFTVTPMLASRVAKVTKLNPKNPGHLLLIGFERFLVWMTDAYADLLKVVLRHWAGSLAVVAIAFVMLIASFGLIGGGYIGAAFISQSDAGQFIIKVELPKDGTLKETNLAVNKVEEYLAKKPEITDIFSTIGRTSGVLSGQATPYLAEVNVKMIPKEERTLRADVYAQQVRNELEKALPGVKVQTVQVSFFGGAGEAPLQVIVGATKLEDAMQYANKLLGFFKEVPGTLAPEVSVEEGSPEIKVDIDRQRMAELGLNIQTVGATMQTAFSGNNNAKYRDGAYEYDINILMDDFDRKNIDDVSQVGFVNPAGELIRLEQFARIYQTTGPSLLERKDRAASVTVKSFVLGRPSGTIGAEIQAKMAESPPPPGVTISYEGDLKNQSEGFGSLLIAMAAALLFMYLIMVALYDNWIYPLVVMFSIPVAMVGALLAMALTMQTLDIFAMLGMIMLIGLVAKNAILLVDFANQMKAEGHHYKEALILAGRTRLRPILMTTIAMVAGMLPIALAKGAGAEWKNALAWALVGGLTSSMLLTLVVIPAVYAIVDRIGLLFTRRKGNGGTGTNVEDSNSKVEVLDSELIA